MAHTQPMPDSEWSSTFKGSPPTALGRTIAKVVSLVESIPLTRDGEGVYVIPDRPRVVSIFGGRGTGKSTALYFSAQELRGSARNLVLPVTDPESFAPGDSLAGWVLAHVDRELTEADRRFVPDAQSGRTIEQLLEELRRAQAVRSGDYLSGLDRRGLSFDDFARDAVKIPAHGVRMAERVSRLVDAVATSRALPDLRLIVPVDDADLFPELLPSIVRDAQMLGSSARATVLFAADPKTLAQSLTIGFLGEHHRTAQTALAEGLISAQNVRELTGRRVTKHFPRSRRVDLPQLSPDQRLAFTPLGASTDTSVLEVLSDFEYGERKLGDLFVIRTVSGERLMTSPYAGALSDNARELRQLHEALTLIDASKPFAASAALALIMRHGLAGLEFDIPEGAAKAIDLQSSEDDARPVAIFDFSEVSFGKSLSRGVTIFARIGAPSERSGSSPDAPPRSSRVTIRSIDRHHARLPDEAHSIENTELKGEENGGGEDLSGLMPDQYGYLVHLAWEAAQGSRTTGLLEMGGYVSRPVLAGGPSWRDTVVGVNGVDWAYWVPPLWEEYSDYFTYQAGWGSFITALFSMDLSANSVTLLELALLIHLDLIATTHLHRAVPDWIGSLDAQAIGALIADGDRIRGELRDEVAERLELALGDARNGTSGRQRDFADWFMLEMPRAASPELTTEQMADWLIELWERHVIPEAREECADRVARIVSDHITSSLSDSDIELLSKIEDPARSDPGESRVERLQGLRAQFREKTARHQAELIKSMQQAEIPPDLISRLREHGATRDVLLTMVNSGLKPEFVTMVAETFPPTPEKSARSAEFDHEMKPGHLPGTAE